VRRLPALAVLAALIVAGVAVDRRARPVTRVTASRNVDSMMPSAAGATSLTSSWYCPGANAVPNAAADGTLVIANPTDRVLPATVTLVPVTGAPKATPVSLEPRSRITIHEGDTVNADQIAALVDFNGGGGVAEQVTSGPLGGSITPCASGASDHWYFPSGSTDKDWQLTLQLFNPFPGDAIVDLSFVTDQGPTAPAEFQGLVIPARGLKALDVGEHVRRRVDVATIVTVRSGRVVADEIQTHSTAPIGAFVLLGAPSVGPLWVFPDGLTADGVQEDLHILNPSDRDAEVEVDYALDEGDAEPFTLTVPASGVYVLHASGEARIPKGIAHAATVRSTNGVGVVATRMVTAAAPATHTGMAEMLGARRAATSWVLAAGTANATTDEWVIAFNPGADPVKVSVTALAAGQPLPIEGLQDVVVPPGRRVALRLGDHIQRDDLPAVVTATGPVYVERDIYRVGGPGISAVIGIPAE
jgi:hypothetical protein